MSELPTAMEAELRKPVVSEFYAIEIALPSATIRLIDGAGFVKFDTGSGIQKFTGRDAVYGVLESADSLRDGFGDTSPAFGFSIQPATDGATLALANPSNQGAAVRAWVGTRDEATNGVHGVVLRFDGFLDFGTIEGELGNLSIDMQCVTWSELFFRTREGITLSHAHHQSNWPGENGLRYITGIQRTVVWGPGERPSTTIYAGGGGYYGEANPYGGFGGGGRGLPNINISSY